MEFFVSKGFEVIDRRSKTGLLWVIGTREELKDTIREASRKYRITGQFGKDADTNGVRVGTRSLPCNESNNHL